MTGSPILNHPAPFFNPPFPLPRPLKPFSAAASPSNPPAAPRTSWSRPLLSLARQKRFRTVRSLALRPSRVTGGDHVPELTSASNLGPQPLLLLALEHKRARDFRAIAALASRLPADWDLAWLELVDEIVFALGHLQRTREALTLGQRAFELQPSHRRASGMAYLYYDASLALPRLRRQQEAALDRETLRKGFRLWIGKALQLYPTSIKDLYRLGVFEAQVESRHDAAALRAFLGAIDAFHALDPAEQQRRGDLRKAYAKALYAGARSALRLDKVRLARKLAFECIRQDRDIDDVEPLHKMHMAARVCLATGELDHAERAARMALDAKGPPRRDYLFGVLSDIALQRGDHGAACSWITEHVAAHRRDSALWRKLGDAQHAAGQIDAAISSWESALRRDRGGRHLTLVRLGRAYLDKAQLGKAEDAFRKAQEFRRTRYMSDEPAALEGLQQVQAARGKGGSGPDVAKVREHKAQDNAKEVVA